MERANCTGTIKAAGGLTIEHRRLGALWLVWLRQGLKRAPQPLLLWLERTRQRRRLSELSDHLLRDIGVSRATARTEGQKRFWQP